MGADDIGGFRVRALKERRQRRHRSCNLPAARMDMGPSAGHAVGVSVASSQDDPQVLLFAIRIQKILMIPLKVYYS